MKLILGTNNIGGALSENQSKELLEKWISSPLTENEVDSAAIYNDGKTEHILGNFNKSNIQKFELSAKVGYYSGFTSDLVVKQIDESLARLQVPCLDTVYLHSPDHSPAPVPIEETLKGIGRCFKDGKFKRFGLSRFPAWQVVDIIHICKEYGCPPPSVYQGRYNIVSRNVEEELLKCLRKFNIPFYAFSPLEAGMLSGKYDFSKQDSEQPVGRFFVDKPDSELSRLQNARLKWYQNLYWSKSKVKEAISLLSEQLKGRGMADLSMIEVAFRWLRHHSQLKEDDGIILGISKPEHFEKNLKLMNKGPLPADVLALLGEVWGLIESKCPKYYR